MRGIAAIADPLEPARGERQRIAVRVAARHHRAQHVDRVARGVASEQRDRIELACGEVHRLGVDELLELADRLLGVAGLEIERAAEQQHPRQRVDRAAGLLDQAAREIIVAGARGEHSLEIIGLRAPRPRLECAAGGGEHVDGAAGVAERRGIFDQRVVIGGVALERGLEPGQRGDQPILRAHHLPAQHQRLEVARIELDRLGRGLDRAEHVACGEAEAGGVGPDIGVLRGDSDRLVDRVARGDEVAERGHRARADAQAIGAVGGVGLLDLGDRLVGFVLEHQRLRDQMVRQLGVVARVDRAADLGLGADAVLQRQLGAGEREVRVGEAGIGADRLERGGARGGGVVGLEQRNTLVERPRIGAPRREVPEGIERQRERAKAPEQDEHAPQRDAVAAVTAGGHRPSSGHRG